MDIQISYNFYGRSVVKDVKIRHKEHDANYKFPVDYDISDFFEFLGKLEKNNTNSSHQFGISYCVDTKQYQKSLWTYLAEDYQDSEEFYFQDDYGLYKTHELWLTKKDTRIIYSLFRLELNSNFYGRKYSYKIVRSKSDIFNVEQTWWIEEIDIPFWEKTFGLKLIEFPFNEEVLR